MAAQSPQFVIGPNTTTVAANEQKFPLATVGNAQLASVSHSFARNARPRPLLNQDSMSIDDQTSGGPRTVDIRVSLNKEFMGDALRACTTMWDTIGTEKQHLWIVDDGAAVTARSADIEVPGSDQEIAYTNTTSSQDFLTGYGTGSLVWFSAGISGTGNEFCVVESHAPSATPNPTFNADLAMIHSANALILRVAIVYPNAYLVNLRPPDALRSGKGFMQLQFVCEDAPLASSLPT